jgi:ABC-type nitrate/sulfonate/bicarbonate transport system ATPase subunit
MLAKPVEHDAFGTTHDVVEAAFLSRRLAKLSAGPRTNHPTLVGSGMPPPQPSR